MKKQITKKQMRINGGPNEHYLQNLWRLHGLSQYKTETLKAKLLTLALHVILTYGNTMRSLRRENENKCHAKSCPAKAMRS